MKCYQHASRVMLISTKTTSTKYYEWKSDQSAWCITMHGWGKVKIQRCITFVKPSVPNTLAPFIIFHANNDDAFCQVPLSLFNEHDMINSMLLVIGNGCCLCGILPSKSLQVLILILRQSIKFSYFWAGKLLYSWNVIWG